MPSRRIVIAGAGIGGLTAALTLARQGFGVVIVEKAAALQPIGAGVQLSPNASRILTDLGLGDVVAARAILPSAVVLNSVRAGGEVARLPLPQQDATAPYWVMHRADLQDVLHAAVTAHADIALRLGTTIEDFETAAGGVSVTLSDQTIEAGALIGADGVGSRIRQKLFPSVSPRPSGRVAWRGVAEAAGPPEVALWMGPHAHLVAYPVAGGAQTNIVVTRPVEAGATGLSGDVVAAQLERAGWPDAPRALIASADTLTPYPLVTVPGLAAWHAGPVALLGDAAHAMLPFAAQGAAMAIEDAAVLARCLGANGEVAKALVRYSDLRRARVARVAKAAEQSGRIYHLDGAMAVARDAAIRLLGGKSLLKRQQWIYDWKP